MGSCAAPSAKGDDKFITTDYLQQCQFGPHDLRRTASTLLHEAGYNTDWIEKCLAHEQKGVRAVYNKAEYREQRAAMLQDWADMIDEWTSGGSKG
ncbi:tyrosine-type recombinase/integrase [Acinetobacter baumannii]|uniref:tyrosine-type recombinase/integrase n=1 Tax=Acinetobacter baumannii TaxID=470 RepID=UPI0008867E00|nr:Prophage CP4-57 integrase [Acinetobacter baumannii]